MRVQQRTGRKCITTISGIPEVFDVRKICKHLKKEFRCNGTVVDDDTYGEVMQLQGDQRTRVNDFLLEEGIVIRDQVRVHGF